MTSSGDDVDGDDDDDEATMLITHVRTSQLVQVPSCPKNYKALNDNVKNHEMTVAF